MTEVSRRQLFALGAVAAGVAPLAGAGPAVASSRLPDGLYSLGVASGDPLPDGVVLWTRLAPKPLDGGGMPDRTVPVQWEIAADESFRRPVRRGVELARPGFAHSVHADVRGLRPSAEYFYRFRVDGQISPVGRTRTAPAPSARPNKLRFAFASCQNYQDGYYVAYRDLVAQDPDFVAFLGDYIYESVPNPNAVRSHDGTGEPYTLLDYRNRHARYRTDPDLQAAHAATPWIITLDDHEIDNNWADDIPQDPDKQTPEAFRARRIAAFQAWYENMPVRRTSLPHGPDLRIFRRLDFGDLFRLHVLDTRQYRSDQPTTLEQANDPARSITGTEQERWLVRGLTTGRQRWNVLANQLMIAQNDRTAGPTQSFDFDNWDGYRAQRKRLMEVFGQPRVANPVVLTGDRHATWVCDLKTDFDNPESATVGAEITGTSISSGGNGNNDSFHRTYDPIKAESPHWKYIDGRRGYMLCDVDRQRMLTTLRIEPVVNDPAGGGTVTAASFVVENDRRGIAVA